MPARSNARASVVGKTEFDEGFNLTMANDRLGFLGGGQMAMALAKGAVQSKIVQPKQLAFCEPVKQQQVRLEAEFPGCQIFHAAGELFSTCERIVLAVKPQVFKEIGSQLGSLTRSEHLYLSILAGFSLAQLSETLRSHRIVRVMPNTPAQVLAGASGMAFGGDVNDADRAWSEKLMKGVGLVVTTNDQSLHAVTGLSGSGPAYVLLVIEALSDGGVAAGLSREVATQLAIQTVLGTAKMAQESGLHPAALRDQVTSPGGTTIAALQVLESRGLRSALIEAVMAATQRSRQLAGN
jgi:pyrroline-5-carboxylate reductase